MTYDRVIEYCVKEDLTVSAFERFCKLGNGTVSKWKDENAPTINSLIKIEKAPGIPIIEWIGGDRFVRN